MTGWQGEAPGRRFGVTVILALVGGVLLLVAGLRPLLPPTAPVAEDPVGPTSTCAEPELDRQPVRVRTSVLLSCVDQFDERFVSIEGEAIGDLFNGPDGRRWVQVNDDAYARVGPLSEHGQTLGTNSGVAVLLPREQPPLVLGGPGVRGDVLRVIGTFEAASDADRGGPAVIAQAVLLVQEGAETGHADPGPLAVATPIAVVVTTVAMGAVWIVRRRRFLA